MAKNKLLKEEAFALFALGCTGEQIAKCLKINPKTVSRWKQKYDWEKRSGHITQILSENVDENVRTIKLRQLKIVQTIQKLGMEQLLAGKIEISVNDTIRAMQHELVLLGEAAERTEIQKMESPLEKALREVFMPDEKEGLQGKPIGDSKDDSG